MPSSYTTSARFTLQATGENNNTWGVILNSGVFQLVDDNINGRLAFNLSGPKALTTALGATDEGRMAFLDVQSGTGGTVTVPAVTQGRFIRNATAGDVTISGGGLASATFKTGDAGMTFCDGSNVYPMLIGGRTVRAHIDFVLASAPTTSPPVAGKAGMFLGNDGVSALEWQTATPLVWSFGGVNSSGLIAANLGPTPAPAVIDAGTAVQLTGPTGLGPRLELNAFGGTPLYTGRGARGTAAAPTATGTGDIITGLHGWGRGATVYGGPRAAINFVANENWTDTLQGAEIQFFTTQAGSNATGVRWKLDGNGHFLPAVANAYDVGSDAVPARVIYSQQTRGQSLVAMNAPGWGQFLSFSAKGTLAAPTATKFGDVLCVIDAHGRAVADWGTGGGGITIQATEDWTNTAQGARMYIRTTPNGSTVEVAPWQFEPNGHMWPTAGNTYDIGSGSAPVRKIYGSNITARLSPATVTTPTFVGNIPSMSVVYVGAGGQLWAHTSGSAPVNDGHIIFAGNFTGGAMTVVQDAGASLTWVNPAGVGLTGNRTVAFGGFITIAAMNTGWLISGTGIT